MASSALWGFIGGFSKTALAQMQERDQEEKDKRKLLLLQELQKEQSDYEYNRSLKEVDNQLTQDDFTTGKRTLKNKQGDTIGITDIPQSALQDYAYKQSKQSLDLQGDQKSLQVQDAQIANMKNEQSTRAAQLGLERQRVGIEAKTAQAQIDAANPENKFGMGNGIDARAHELMYQNKDIVDSLERDGVPAEVISKLATDSVVQTAARAAKGQRISLVEVFRNGAGILRQSAKKNRNTYSNANDPNRWALDPTSKTGY